MFFKTYKTEFEEIVVKCMDQNGRLLEIEDEFNLKLLIDKYRTKTMKIC